MGNDTDAERSSRAIVESAISVLYTMVDPVLDFESDDFKVILRAAIVGIEASWDIAESWNWGNPPSDKVQETREMAVECIRSFGKDHRFWFEE